MALRLFVLVAFFWALSACRVATFPMHEPIYPAANEGVRYTLSVKGNYPIRAIRLYEQVSIVDSTGVERVEAEKLLKEWFPQGFAASYDVEYEHGGHASSRLIRYRFLVELLGGKHHSHEVTYAIRPYPVMDPKDGSPVPAPVYGQRSPRDSIDLVFVPDTDVTEETAFRDHCRKMITEAMWEEPTLASWTRSFNYYINPLPGTAVDHAVPQASHHKVPRNDKSLSFAEAKVLMHEADLQDWWRQTKRIFSTEVDARWTMLHELGHAVFGLADEHVGGAHFQPKCAKAPCPQNNWYSRPQAEDDTARYAGKSVKDARLIETETTASGKVNWFKICADLCQMDSSLQPSVPGLFDLPCVERIHHVLLGKWMSP